MGTNSVACTVVGQTRTSGTMGSYSTSATAYAGKAGSYYYTYFLKFTLPQFSGVAEELEFGLYLTTGIGTSPGFRAAICSSDANAASYINATAPVGEVEDPFQLSAGTVSFPDVTNSPKLYTFRLDAAGLQAGQTAYLILWASEAVGVSVQATTSTYGNATAVLHYNAGLVRLDTGDGFAQALACIEIDGVQTQVIPCIDTGTGWLTGS